MIEFINHQSGSCPSGSGSSDGVCVGVTTGMVRVLTETTGLKVDEAIAAAVALETACAWDLDGATDEVVITVAEAEYNGADKLDPE